MTTSATPVFPPQTQSQRANCYTYLTNLLSMQKTDKAVEYARKHQLVQPADPSPLDTIRLFLDQITEERAQRKAENERVLALEAEEAYRKTQECANEEALTVTFQEIPLYGDWPETVELEVLGECRNPRLLHVALPDKRRATLWKGYLKPRPGLKVVGRIETFRDAGGLQEVIYERV